MTRMRIKSLFFCAFESHTIFAEYLRIISLLDLTKQISKESSRYPVAQGSFGDVWKCIRKHPQITVEASSSFEFSPVNMRL
jgi:hypothetical protein